MKSIQLTSVLSLVLNGVFSVVIDNQVGRVQILYQNDLTSNTTSTSALFIQSEKSYKDASAACRAFSETLLDNVPSDVKDQLNYLVFSGQLESNAQLYISFENIHDGMRTCRGREQSCLAYHVAEEKVVEVDCGTELPALCTQSADVSQLGYPISNSREITVNSLDYAITG